MDVLKTQFSSINYILKAIIEQTHLASHSKYWQKFGITNPSFNVPTMLTLPQGGDVPQTYFGIDLNQAETDFWDDIIENLKVL